MSVARSNSHWYFNHTIWSVLYHCGIFRNVIKKEIQFLDQNFIFSIIKMKFNFCFLLASYEIWLLFLGLTLCGLKTKMETLFRKHLNVMKRFKNNLNIRMKY